MSDVVVFEDKQPLLGEVEIEASGISAINIIAASLFLDREIILSNIPNVSIVQHALDVIIALGAKVAWIDDKSLLINGSNINANCPSGDPRVVILLLPVLLSKFGKVVLQSEALVDYIGKYEGIKNTLDKFNVLITKDDNSYEVSYTPLTESLFVIKEEDYLGTVLAALFSCLNKQTDIELNFSVNDPEIEDLIQFLTSCGYKIDMQSTANLHINGFDDTLLQKYKLASDINLIVFFSLAALMSEGNILIRNVARSYLTSFLSFLTKTGSLFDLSGNNLKVWAGTKVLTGADIYIGNYPNLIKDWLPMLLVYLSTIAEPSTIRIDAKENLHVIGNLDHLGINVDVEESNGVNTLTLSGHSAFKSGKFYAEGVPDCLALLLYGLASTAKFEFGNPKLLETYYKNLYEKLIMLGSNLIYKS